MSKSSRKLWKAYIHFPYDLMKLHTWEVAKFQYQFICMSTLCSPKLTLDTVPLWSPKISVHAMFLRRQWMIWFWDAGCTHAILQRSAKSSDDVQVSADGAFIIHLPSWTQPRSELLEQMESVSSEMTQRSGKGHVRSNVQAAAAATLSNLDWKTKR